MVGCGGRASYPLCLFSGRSFFLPLGSSRMYSCLASHPFPFPPSIDLFQCHSAHPRRALRSMYDLRCMGFVWVLLLSSSATPPPPPPPPPPPCIPFLCTPAMSCHRPTVLGASFSVHVPVLTCLALTRAFSRPRPFYEKALPPTRPRSRSRVESSVSFWQPLGPFVSVPTPPRPPPPSLDVTRRTPAALFIQWWMLFVCALVVPTTVPPPPPPAPACILFLCTPAMPCHRSTDFGVQCL
ncbi:hypothetical protein I4F81_006348 [Pyropia yezoensis]|uniref:Uncharacterized protein n=1 Tax=Pyropia yezoensis TaxID=2788 RepID=A0ACC3C0E2_PYRYE|nr:hypothetical protein I4F81_006348 [Neopyropia yezoensis]